MTVPRAAADWVGLDLSDGRYRIIKTIGEGGMGLVYQAHDRRLGTDVVVKVPSGTVQDDPEFSRRFAREIRSLIRLSHPNIVTVIDVGSHDGMPFAVMQFLAGGSLDERRQTAAKSVPAGPADGRLLSWLPRIAEALDFVHANGYVHRDVKPANILFDRHGHPYLSDFGVAKIVADCADKTHGGSLTDTGLVIGTPQYMAPELIMGQPFDGRVDQYALAVTVFERLAGRSPFDGPTPAAFLVQHSTQQPAYLCDVQPSIPRAVADAVQRGLSKPPAKRFPSCTELASAVMAAQIAVPVDSAAGVASVSVGETDGEGFDTGLAAILATEIDGPRQRVTTGSATRRHRVRQTLRKPRTDRNRSPSSKVRGWTRSRWMTIGIAGACISAALVGGVIINSNVVNPDTPAGQSTSPQVSRALKAAKDWIERGEMESVETVEQGLNNALARATPEERDAIKKSLKQVDIRKRDLAKAKAPVPAQAIPAEPITLASKPPEQGGPAMQQGDTTPVPSAPVAPEYKLLTHHEIPPPIDNPNNPFVSGDEGRLDKRKDGWARGRRNAKITVFSFLSLTRDLLNDSAYQRLKQLLANNAETMNWTFGHYPYPVGPLDDQFHDDPRSPYAAATVSERIRDLRGGEAAWKFVDLFFETPQLKEGDLAVLAARVGIGKEELLKKSPFDYINYAVYDKQDASMNLDVLEPTYLFVDNRTGQTRIVTDRPTFASESGLWRIEPASIEFLQSVLDEMLRFYDAQREEGIARIRKAGGKFTSDEVELDRPIVTIALTSPEATATVISYLKYFPELRSLKISLHQIDKVAIDALKPLKALKELHVSLDRGPNSNKSIDALRTALPGVRVNSGKIVKRVE